MTQEQLKRFRLLVPGILLVLFSLPVLQMNFQGEPIWKSIPTLAPLSSLLPDWITTSLIIIALGAIYYITGIRRYFLSESLNAIHDNIKARLLQPFKQCTQIATSMPHLLEGRTLLDIFYSFIDNDETLKARATNVRFNGLVWTSTADLAAVSLIGSIAYLVTGLVIASRVFIILAVGSGVVHVLATTAIMPSVTKRHIALGNEQLEFIRSQYLTDLKEKLIASTQEK